MNLANFCETKIFDRYIKLIYNALNHPELLSDEQRAIQGTRRLMAYEIQGIGDCLILYFLRKLDVTEIHGLRPELGSRVFKDSALHSPA